MFSENVPPSVTTKLCRTLKPSFPALGYLDSSGPAIAKHTDCACGPCLANRDPLLAYLVVLQNLVLYWLGVCYPGDVKTDGYQGRQRRSDCGLGPEKLTAAERR